MEPFLGQIQLFPYNFAPRGWAPCDGQILQISQNTPFVCAAWYKLRRGWPKDLRATKAGWASRFARVLHRIARRFPVARLAVRLSRIELATAQP